MLTTPAKPSAGSRQESQIAVSNDRAAALTKSIRGALESYLRGRKLVRVQIRHVEGSKTEGFLKIEGGKAERLLLDFKATSAIQGGLSSLEVGGKKISLVAGSPPAKRGRRSRDGDGKGAGGAPERKAA